MVLFNIFNKYLNNNILLNNFTIQGGIHTASISDGNAILTDMKGNKSTIIITDVIASNGVIHAIDSVVLPN